ncbi:lymphocyte cytosolic protein 2-like isoform X2 [Ornithodoros turicata]|uniref:lymphocyte cytosolic protein 2-like isoform X2 n=1 Tax=Ornithodoros turicata TaxID=34597 RepID=UPI00313A249B
MSTALRLPPAKVLMKWDSTRLSKWLAKNGFEDLSAAITSKHLDGKGLLDMQVDAILTIFSEARLSRRKQLAKCVTECKTQAANAKHLVGDMKHSVARQKTNCEVSSGGQDDDEDDDEDWSWDTDFDDSEPENDVPPPVSDVMPVVNYGALNGVNKADSTYSPNGSEGKEECTSVSSISSEASSYASGSSGSIQPTTAKRVIPKPPDGPALPRPPEGRPVLRPGVRPVVRRPPSHPPPPPVQNDQNTCSSPDASEDYEVPISHPPSARGYPPQYKPDNRPPTSKPYTPEDTDGSQDYAHVDSLTEGGDYEIVGESPWQPPTPPCVPPPIHGNVPLPPRVGGQQVLPFPPPPLPVKPAHIRELVSGGENRQKPDKISVAKPNGQHAVLQSQPSSKKNYEDTSTLAALIAKRPLPPVPPSLTEAAPSPVPPPVPRIPVEEETLESYPWFHDIEREQVDFYLRDREDGAYLVRVSKRGGDNNPYTLSIFYKDRIFHLNIRRRNDNTYALGTEKPMEKTFTSIPELIEYHQQEPIILTSKGRPAGQTSLVVTPHPARIEPSR